MWDTSLKANEYVTNNTMSLREAVLYFKQHSHEVLEENIKLIEEYNSITALVFTESMEKIALFEEDPAVQDQVKKQGLGQRVGAVINKIGAWIVNIIRVIRETILSGISKVIGFFRSPQADKMVAIVVSRQESAAQVESNGQQLSKGNNIVKYLAMAKKSDEAENTQFELMKLKKRLLQAANNEIKIAKGEGIGFESSVYAMTADVLTAMKHRSGGLANILSDMSNETTALENMYQQVTGKNSELVGEQKEDYIQKKIPPKFMKLKEKAQQLWEQTSGVLNLCSDVVSVKVNPERITNREETV